MGIVSRMRPGIQGSWHPFSLLTWLLISWWHAGPAADKDAEDYLNEHLPGHGKVGSPPALMKSRVDVRGVGFGLP